MISRSELEIFGIPDPDGFIGGCAEFYRLLAEANRMTNLTRIDSEDGFRIKHVIDSLYIAACFPQLRTARLSIADIGCGAGFPAVILALAFPGLAITAIDSAGKKIAFVGAAAEKLGLANLAVIQGRTREMACRREWQGKFQLITARAVGAAPLVYQDSCRMLAPGGRFILYKTPQQAALELPELAAVKPTRAWRRTETFSLPENSGERCFLYF